MVMLKMMVAFDDVGGDAGGTVDTDGRDSDLYYHDGDGGENDDMHGILLTTRAKQFQSWCRLS